MKLTSALLTAALLAALGAYAWRGWYTRYVTDDYCSAAAIQDYGFAGAMKAHRETWSGRFSYFLVKGALELIGPVTARFVPGVMLVLTLLAAAWALRPLTARPGLAACAVAFAAVDSAPDRFGIYGPFAWETGAVTYMLPIVLLLVWTGVLVRGGNIALSFALMVAAGGVSETSLAAQGALAAGALRFALLRRDRRRAWISGAALAATLLALAIVATAPGNEKRATTLPSGAAAGIALEAAYDYLGSHLFVEGLALALVAAVALVTKAGDRRPLLQASMVALLCYIASFFPAAWAISSVPPPRALYVPNVFLIAALFCAAAALRVRAPQWLLVAAAVIPVWSTVQTVRTIPEARAGAMQADAINRSLREQRGGGHVVLRSRWALTSGYAGVDAGHPANHCMSEYYRLQSLRVVP